MDIFLLFPVHLFSNINNLKGKKIYLLEEPRFFDDFQYHKLKIAYHRATLKCYYDFLKSKKINVSYISYDECTIKFYKDLVRDNDAISMYDPADNILKKKVLKLIPKINILNSLNFLVNEGIIHKNIDEFYNGKKYNHDQFYKWQRIRLEILVDSENKPIGGQWSFDKDNRKKMPESVKVPPVLDKLNEASDVKKYVEEGKKYAELHFSKNYGSLEHFIYPINHDDSKKWLKNFLKNKFENFGAYEDAESMKDPFLFHSVLTPMMNIGLITDNEVLDLVLPYQNKVPLASFEGFIRQIIGWRNYIYTMYVLEGNKIKSGNFLNHRNILIKNIVWEGKTKILPMDNIIHKIVEYGYAHHIERLMYLGNYMLLCMVNPNDVYNIFMEWTIDAYEWVMIPNVYSMSQYADGGLMMTRPYFSSSNYILKMSDYKKPKGVNDEENWCVIFDALYYNFIKNHEEYLSKNYATSRQVAFWRKKSPSEKKKIVQIAEQYLESMFVIPN
jgi:deoxyribodipyrimidine photolyase-related protein